MYCCGCPIDYFKTRCMELYSRHCLFKIKLLHVPLTSQYQNFLIRAYIFRKFCHASTYIYFLVLWITYDSSKQISYLEVHTVFDQEETQRMISLAPCLNISSTSDVCSLEAPAPLLLACNKLV